MKRNFGFLALVLPALLAACSVGGTATSNAQVPASCLTTAHDDNGTVAATFHSTIGVIRRLPAVANNPQLASYAEDEEATICYIDGQIPKGPPPPASRTIPPSFDRAVLVVVGDQTYPVTLGYSENIPVQAP